MSKKIGSYLRKTREDLGISLDELSAQTRIERSALEAIESGRFDLLPGPIYVRSYIRTYAIYVGLDPRPITRNLTIQTQAQEKQPDLLVGQKPVRSINRVKRTSSLPSRQSISSNSLPNEEKKVESLPTRSSRKEIAATRSKVRKKKSKSLYSRFLTFGFILLAIFALVVFFLHISTDEVDAGWENEIQQSYQSKNQVFLF